MNFLRLSLIVFLSGLPSLAFATSDHHYFLDPLRLGGTNTAPATQLDINGSLKIGNGGETCNATNAGALRWNGTAFQGCNGSAWDTFGSGSGLSGSGSGTSISAGNTSLATADTGSDGTITFTTESANRGNISSTGNWKVGSSSSAATKLDVAGSIKVGNGSETCNSTYAGSLRYNTTTSVMEFCNGSAWGTVLPTTVPSGAGHFVNTQARVNGCLGGAAFFTYGSGVATVNTYDSGAGFPHYMRVGDTVIVSDTSSVVYQGTFTVTAVTDAYTFEYNTATSPPLAPGSNGTFCRGSGGLTAANTLCLRILTDNTDWRGYAGANAMGQLTGAKVKAFLCDNSTCNNLQANTTYYYSSVGDVDAGGSSFATDSSGRGPGQYDNWVAGNTFGYVIPSGNPDWHWTGRAEGSSNYWPTSGVSGQTCSNWSSATGTAIVGFSGSSNELRWNGVSSEGYIDCGFQYNLICYVEP